MPERNQIYETVVEDYTAEGLGVARIEGMAVFVPNAVAGERCRVRITHIGKNRAAGRIVEILERSPHRVNRACPTAKLCGGCDFWHMDYAEECRLKAERVRQALNRLAGETLESVPILGAPTVMGYRNKAQYPVTCEKGRAVAGFFRAGTHQVVHTPRCAILPKEMDDVRDAVIAYMNRFGVSAYEEETGKGLVRHIYVRRGDVTGQILVCLVVNGRQIPKPQALIERLRQIPGFTTLVLSVNTRPGNSVLGKEYITLYGQGYITDVLCGLTFRLSPASFYQVNHTQAQALYALAIQAADIQKTDTVLDLCCGAGTITLCMAGAAGKVIGVEIVPEAVADAKENAKRNGIENAEFLCADVAKIAAELDKRGIRADVVTVDPPRKGLAPVVLEAIAAMRPRRVVYVSCDPATLARDVALLKQQGYQVQTVQAVDLFPRCAHVETVVLLSHKSPDSH